MQTPTAPVPVLEADPPDASVGADAGVEGNARLTAALGLLLTLLLLAEGVTILSIRQLITAHIAIGLLLVAPVAVKIATTTYRFARYYQGDARYVQRGAPPLVLRAIGPLVVLSTVSLLGTGVALLFRRPDHAGVLLLLHKASFIVWGVLMAVHFLGHVLEAVRLVARDVRGRRAAPAGAPTARGIPSPSRWPRMVVLAVTLVVAVGTAAAVTPGNHWSDAGLRHQERDGSGHHR